MKKWTRVTTAGAQPAVDSTVDNVSAGTSNGPPKLSRGKDKSLLYGAANAGSTVRPTGVKVQPKPGAPAPSEESAVSQADFEFWKRETLDPKTGRTGDSKVLYNVGGEDRGVCRDALVGRACQRGAQCPFSHPVRQYSRAGKEICLGMSQLSVRYDMRVDSCAVVKILNVVSPLSFSVFVLDCSTVDDLGSCLSGEKQVEPFGFWNLLTEMLNFYMPTGSADICPDFQALESVTEVFVAVYWRFHDKLWWLRGIVMDLSETADGDFCLKVNLPDIGMCADVTDPKAVRRLENRFLAEPWFSARIGLAKIKIPGRTASVSTLEWFRRLITDKIAWIKVVDEEFNLPLVELYLQLGDGRGLRNLNEYLIEEQVAVRRAVTGLDYNDTTTGSDQSETDDDGPLEIIPG